jgi:hypothetical protein
VNDDFIQKLRIVRCRIALEPVGQWHLLQGELRWNESGKGLAEILRRREKRPHFRICSN